MNHERKPLLPIGRFQLRRYSAPALAALVTACASVQPAPGRKETAPVPSVSSIPPAAPLAKSTQKKQSAARAVDIKADCSWKDENGYAGKMKLLTSQNVVQEFSAAVNHPKHGRCNFSLAEFHQTQETPNVELKSATSSCTVRMWAQGRQVSVAFSSCKAMCTGDVVDYLWPILADATTGSCG